jgi:serine protease AprX
MRTSSFGFAASLLLVALLGTPLAASAQTASAPKLDPLLQRRASLLIGSTKVVVRAADTVSLTQLSLIVQLSGGSVGRLLPIVGGLAATVPNASLTALSASSLVAHLSMDRVAAGAMERTGRTVGATAVRQQFGYDGTGVGVAIIDSGITAWHDDLTDAATGGQRVARFVDFVGGRGSPYDDYGHGTHVAGIVAGNGFDSSGARSGIAPAATLTVLKVLDQSGAGRISDVIAALDYAVAHRAELNIKVVNLSVATGVYESYYVDPLTLAARAAVNAGIVVVAAAGNNGRTPQGATRYGGVTAPGNAPWVLTVGASSHMGTIDRSDDTMAAFSSRGPTAVDRTAKPDLVAPGVGIESLSDPLSAFYSTKAPYLLPGTVPTAYLPYLSLSGTSMATPVVAGTVALMLQANPALTPNAVKAILEYTAQIYAQYDPLTEGAGFLNAKGAVDLARFFAAPIGDYPSSPDWSTEIIWGDRAVAGGRLMPWATGWSRTIAWGATTTETGAPTAWGVICSAADCTDSASWTTWDTTGAYQNVVWGTTCGGLDCTPSTTTSVAGALLGSSGSGGVLIWGTSGGDTVVWGTTDGDTVVWGTNDDGDTVVWGTSCSDPSCQPVIWNP